MSKALMYFKKTGEIRDRYGDWDGDEGFDFYYEPDEDKMQDEVINLLFDFYFSADKNKFNSEQVAVIKIAFRNFINSIDNWDDLYDDFEDDLTEIFRAEAFASVR